MAWLCSGDPNSGSVASGFGSLRSAGLAGAKSRPSLHAPARQHQPWKPWKPKARTPYGPTLRPHLTALTCGTGSYQELEEYCMVNLQVQIVCRTLCLFPSRKLASMSEVSHSQVPRHPKPQRTEPSHSRTGNICRPTLLSVVERC